MTSGSRKDPAWIRVADRCYGFGLSFFSSAHRSEYGALMRQAFRDRCREIARGERSAWRSFALELAPDLISSIGTENMNSIFGDMRPRHVVMLAMLTLSSAYLLVGEAMGLRLSDLAFTANRAASNLGRKVEAAALRARLLKIAEPLAAESSAKSKALAALMYRYADLTTDWHVNEDNRADVVKSTVLFRTTLAGPADPYLLAILARQCWPRQRLGDGATIDPWSCNLEGVTRRLLEQTPDNGYAWASEYRLGALARDPARMRRALAGLAAASHYNAYEGRIAGDLLTEVTRLAPDDARTLDSVATVFVRSGWSSSVRLGAFCDPADSANKMLGISVAQIDAAREDCVRAGRVMATSTNLDTALRGGTIVAALSDDPAERASAEAKGRELQQLADQLQLVEKRNEWMFSDKPRVAMWLATFRAGEGEIPSTRRWLRSRGTQVLQQH